MPQTRKKSQALGKSVRRSISLSGKLSTRVDALAREQRRSVNQVIEGLVQAGLEARETEKRRFFDVAERLRASTDAQEVKKAKEELARMIFGS